MVQYVAAKTLDRAIAVITASPGVGRDEIAHKLGMRRSSIQHVTTALRSTGEILPVDVIRARSHVQYVPECPIQARILRRARKGLVVVGELPEEITDEEAQDVLDAVRLLRARKAIEQARGYWPASSHYDAAGRARRYMDLGR